MAVSPTMASRAGLVHHLLRVRDRERQGRELRASGPGGVSACFSALRPERRAHSTRREGSRLGSTRRTWITRYVRLVATIITPPFRTMSPWNATPEPVSDQPTVSFSFWEYPTASLGTI